MVAINSVVLWFNGSLRRRLSLLQGSFCLTVVQSPKTARAYLHAGRHSSDDEINQIILLLSYLQSAQIATLASRD